ncbi:winged helix-turn-helix transcriptional regulator [Microbacterium sp. 2MCAF23]|uniref:winged helix-turn-helix transcriptional regulator n=1 Tax=Microbacterium sp. 2MCAF23 TaxID=3232985 RepID=UPI003F9C8C98
MATPGADVINLEGAFAERDLWPSTGWCRMERALEVVGTKSAMLIVRELFYGGSRFDELARRTGLSDAVASGRLKQLHADGLVEQRPYQDPGKRTRKEYVLTERGRALYPLLVALMQWGEGVRDDHDTGVELVHVGCGASLEATVRCADGHDVSLGEAGARLKDERLASALRGRAATAARA